jgi:hypothetical protein
VSDGGDETQRPEAKPPVELTIEAYAELQVALAEGDRAAALVARGLDEAAFDALDREMQAKLSAAMDEGGDGVPPLLAAYDRAIQRARAASPPPLSLEAFARATAAIRATGDAPKALARLGIGLEAYLRANGYWTPKLGADPALAAAFAAAFARG